LTLFLGLPRYSFCLGKWKKKKLIEWS